MTVIDEDGTVGWFYYENGIPDGMVYMGIDRSVAVHDRCFLHTRTVFEDGTVGPTKTREISFGEMVAQKATLEMIRLRRAQ